MNIRLSAAALACASLLAVRSTPAAAHVIAGNRVFPVTLTFDDPGVSDEASLPALTYQRGGADGGTGPSHEVDLGFEFDKTITPTTALIINGGYDIQQMNGSKTQTGFENIVITGKWQAYTNAAHEFVASLGIQREIGGTGTTHTGGDRYGSTTPTVYFGKGLGDLPIGLLRPLAVTGELGYTIADKKLKGTQVTDSDSNMISTQFNNGNNNAWAGGISVQYSIPYLQSQVKDFGLPSFLGNLVPVVELTWTSPASTPSAQGTTWTIAPGVIYLAQWGEVGVEALIPANKAAGTNVGVAALVHVFFDDLYPTSLGKPLFE
ncbi:MAG: hypothetical protein WDN49_25640 [Acetobacteraceae bacterium]